jgi:hypothetical protein
VLPSWRQQGATIVGVGESVALSADASIMAIGDYHTMGYVYVKVYHTDDDGVNRVQLGQTIYGDATNDYFGRSFGISIDITPDGNTLAIGSSKYVRVFSLEGDSDLGTDNWKQIGQDIISEVHGTVLGARVSISEDGRTIAVGVPSFETINSVTMDPGHVTILVNDGTSWQKIGQDIIGEAASDFSGVAASDFSGVSVALSADGSTVAIGASRSSNRSGQVAVYRINSEGSSWERLGQTIFGNAIDEGFGNAMDITPDGNTLAIGSGFKQYDGGQVKVFSLTSGEDINNAITWNQIGQVGVGNWISVSLSDDGKTLAIGSRYDYGGDSNLENWVGRASVHRMDESKSNWIQIGDDIDGASGNSVSGSIVSLSADGNKVAIGSSSFSDESSYTRVYVLE